MPYGELIPVSKIQVRRWEGDAGLAAGLAELNYVFFSFPMPFCAECRGITLKHSMKGLDYTLELCKDAEVYQANGLYLDTQLEVEDIHWYMEMSVETEGGVRVTVPVSRSGWWWRMWFLQSGQGWRLEKMCVVELDVSRYLVAK